MATYCPFHIFSAILRGIGGIEGPTTTGWVSSFSAVAVGSDDELEIGYLPAGLVLVLAASESDGTVGLAAVPENRGMDPSSEAGGNCPSGAPTVPLLLKVEGDPMWGSEGRLCMLLV